MRKQISPAPAEKVLSSHAAKAGEVMDFPSTHKATAAARGGISSRMRAPSFPSARSISAGEGSAGRGSGFGSATEREQKRESRF